MHDSRERPGLGAGVPWERGVVVPFKVAQSQGLASGVFPRGAYCRSPPRIR